MLLRSLIKIKSKIIKYCFWCLNENLKIENFPQPFFENKNITIYEVINKSIL